MFKYLFVFTLGVCWCVFGEEVITFVRFSLMAIFFPLGFVRVLVRNILIVKGYCWKLLVNFFFYKYFLP